MNDLDVPRHAVILAGGAGARLAPYTTVFPKPLMPVGGKPVLEHLLLWLHRQGVRRATLAVNQLGELIRAFFGDGSKLGMELDYHREDRPLGTAGVLSVLKDLLDPCLLVNGDILTTLDLAAMARHHRERGAAMTVAVRARTVRVDFGVVTRGSDGDVAAYQEQPSVAYLVSMGVHLIGSKARESLLRGEHCHVPDLVLRLLGQRERVAAFQSNAYWRDVGRTEDYEAVGAEMAERGQEVAG